MAVTGLDHFSPPDVNGVLNTSGGTDPGPDRRPVPNGPSTSYPSALPPLPDTDQLLAFTTTSVPVSLETQFAQLVRRGMIPEAQRSVGSIVLSGAGKAALGGVIGAVAGELVFPAGTADWLRDTVGGRLFVESRMAETREGSGASPAQRQLSILSLANQEAIDSLLQIPQLHGSGGGQPGVDQIGQTEWDTILAVYNKIKTASENFPGQEFNITQTTMADGSTLLALQRGTTLIPLMLNDALVSQNVIHLPYPSPSSPPLPSRPSTDGVATQSQSQPSPEELQSLAEQITDLYNAAFKRFVNSDLSPDALRQLQEDLNQVELRSRHVQGFYTSEQRAADLAIARQATNLLAEYDTAIGQLYNLAPGTAINHDLLQSLPEKVSALGQNPLVNINQREWLDNINHAGVAAVQWLATEIEAGHAFEPEWLRNTTNTLQALSDKLPAPFFSAASREELRSDNQALIELPTEVPDISEAPEEPLPLPGENPPPREAPPPPSLPDDEFGGENPYDSGNGPRVGKGPDEYGGPVRPGQEDREPPRPPGDVEDPRHPTDTDGDSASMAPGDDPTPGPGDMPGEIDFGDPPPNEFSPGDPPENPIVAGWWEAAEETGREFRKNYNLPLDLGLSFHDSLGHGLTGLGIDLPSEAALLGAEIYTYNQFKGTSHAGLDSALAQSYPEDFHQGYSEVGQRLYRELKILTKQEGGKALVENYLAEIKLAIDRGD